jgi:hypothetical protein
MRVFPAPPAHQNFAVAARTRYAVAVKWTLFMACLVCVPLAARAELSTMREHARQMDSGKVSVGGEMTSFFGDVDNAGYTLVQPTLFASARFREAVFEALAPFTYVHERPDEGASHNLFGVGNPWFALAYLPDTSCGLARLSLGVAPELANGSSPRKERALALARGAHGGVDAYLFTDRLFPLVLGVGTLKELAHLRLSFDADAILGLPVRTRDVELGAQTQGELALRFAWHTQVGVRGSLAYYPTLPGDKAQTSLALIARHARPRGDSFAAKFVMNLDGPAGFSFADGGMWGLSLLYATSL